MADDTLQYGTADTISTDHLTNLNGSPITQTPTSPKAQRVKVQFGDDGIARDVSSLFALPVGLGQSADIVQVISANSPTSQIDCTGYRWAYVQVGVGYVGQTTLTAQCSNDGTNWFSWALCRPSDSSSGITTSIGVTLGIWHGPISTKYIRFIPAGTYSSGSQTITVTLTTAPSVLNSQGVNASLTSANMAATFSVGTASGNQFCAQVTGTGTAAGVQLLAAVSGITAYMSDIVWSNSGATASLLSLVAASSANGRYDIWMPAGSSGSVAFKSSWRISTTSNIALNYSISAATTSWYATVMGYYS